MEQERDLVAYVNDRYEEWKKIRKPHEVQWYINAAFRRGQQHVAWNDVEAKLITPPLAPHRERRVINRIRPKVDARRAKALKNRPIPEVLPASTDREDIQNARASKKVLDYTWRRLNLEMKYREAVEWAEVCGKSYWWIQWDPSAIARVRLDNPELMEGNNHIFDIPIGDVSCEVGSLYEVLAADPTIADIQNQPEIMRVKVRPVEDVKARYPEVAEQIKADTSDRELFYYEDKIGTLHAATAAPGLPASVGRDSRRGRKGEKEDFEFVTVKELFVAPCARYPRGRYMVVAGDVLLRSEEELPYQLYRTSNPFPVVEFVDMHTAGQFYSTTLIEQLVDLQREYNRLIELVVEQIKLMSRPKIIVFKQHQLPDGAWGAVAGEIIELNYVPGLPPPIIVQPANIAQDVWRRIENIKQEMEDLTQIYPASEGAVGSSKSGFQTNLLQEASDTVHAPYLRGLELAIEQAARIFRRIMKQGYEIPRLITITSRNAEADVFEFSSDEIDEHADIIVQAGSALPQLKAARIESVLNLYGQGLFGPPEDPEVRRKVLSMLDLGTVEDGFQSYRRDEELSRLEMTDLERSGQIRQPEFFEDHNVHYAIHTDKLKSVEARKWPPEMRMALIEHIIRHAYFIEPGRAATLAAQYGLQHLLQQPPLGAPPPPPPPGMGMPAPQGRPAVPQQGPAGPPQG